MPLLGWLAAKLLDPRVLLTLAAVVAIGLGSAWLRHSGFKAGASSVQIAWEADKLARSEAANKALERQRAEFQDQINRLDANHAQTKRLRDAFAVDATAAENAASASARESRRLRDAIATSDAATRRAIDAAGAARQCAPAIEAADLRGRMLERLDSAAGEVEDAARGISRHADEAWAAASECAGAYEVARNKAPRVARVLP